MATENSTENTAQKPRGCAYQLQSNIKEDLDDILAHAYVVNTSCCNEAFEIDPEMIARVMSKVEGFATEAIAALNQLMELPSTQPPIERDLTIGNERVAEQRELVKRLDKLPIEEARDVCALVTTLQIAEMRGETDKRRQIFSLLQSEPVSCINSYNFLSDRGKVQLTAAPDKGDHNEGES